MDDITIIILLASGLVLASIVLARLLDNFGLPTIVLFLGIGMLAGSEGPGGIHFDDPHLAQFIGTAALVLILFSGGLDTRWSSVKSMVAPAVSLATVGVVLTASLVAGFGVIVCGLSLHTALLLGAVISSTDAAAVFSVLRTSGTTLRARVQSVLELESGTNDPLAVLLTVGIIEWIKFPEYTAWRFLALLLQQIGIGLALGLLFGKGLVVTVNSLRLKAEGIYPVFALAAAGLGFGAATAFGGSGFLAVYLMGLVAGSSDFVRKKTVVRFFDGIAWLSQIGLFLALGLLVFPSRMVPFIWTGLAVSGVLIFVARPVSVFVSLLFDRVRWLGSGRLGWREKGFISWVGLRGAVPIVLATFPLMAGLPDSQPLFNLVFFIVLISALVQGWTVPFAARLFRVAETAGLHSKIPIEMDAAAGVDADLVDLTIPAGSAVVGRRIVELNLPHGVLIALIGRQEQYFIPTGETAVEAGDTLLLLSPKSALGAVRLSLESKQ